MIKFIFIFFIEEFAVSKFFLKIVNYSLQEIFTNIGFYKRVDGGF